MPSIVQNYEILLDFTNDTLDSVTVQLLHDYGRSSRSTVLLNPDESVTLVLDAGSIYRYAVKSRTKVVSISARSWRDTRCQISCIFSEAPLNPGPGSPYASTSSFDGIRVDRHWRDHRFNIWDND